MFGVNVLLAQCLPMILKNYVGDKLSGKKTNTKSLTNLDKTVEFINVTENVRLEINHSNIVLCGTNVLKMSWLTLN
jgi:hypothetical protein